jgi:hypothetical protein
MRLILPTVAAASVLLGGCTDRTTTPSHEPANNGATASAPSVAVDPLPALDRRSPDMVVKSYWALQDWQDKNMPRVFPKLSIGEYLEKFFQAQQGVSGGEYKKHLQGQVDELRAFPGFTTGVDKVIEREILEVKNESETRAIVLAKIKNVTPLPQGMVLNDWNKKDRDYGTDVRYILEKDADGWSLTQAFQRDQSAISLDELKAEKDRTGGWTKVWTIKEKTSGPSQYTFSATEP